MTRSLQPHAFMPARGRPRSPDIERRIIQVAQLFFAQRAFGDVPMDEIAGEAGTSKATIYLYFRSKQELFTAALDDLLAQLPPATELTRTSSGDLISQQLLIVAMRVNQLLSSMSFELIRRTLASNISAPLRQRIWRTAGLPYVEAISDYLLIQADRGLLTINDAKSSASLFIRLVAGGKALHSQLSGSSFGFIEEHNLREAVELFVRGHTADGTLQ